MKLLTGGLVALCFISCKSQFPIAYDSNNAKNPEYKAYIKTTKGEVVSGDVLEKKNEAKLFKQTIYSINGTEFKSKEVREYQDASGLYASVGGSFSKALAGPRIMVFKNISTSIQYNQPSAARPYGGTSTKTDVTYYIMKAGQDDYKRVGIKSTKKLAEWVEDNNDAYEQAMISRSMGKHITRHALISWGAIVGGMVMMLNDPAVKDNAPKDKNVGVMAYGGLGLLTGGIVNLGINLLHRRGVAGRAYAEAINIYNETPVKKKK